MSRQKRRRLLRPASALDAEAGDDGGGCFAARRAAAAAQGWKWGPRPLTPRPGMPVTAASPRASQNSALA